MIRVCSTSDVDETCQGPDVEDSPKSEPMDVRDACLSIWDIVQSGKVVAGAVMALPGFRQRHGGVRTLDDFRSILMFGCEWPTTKRRTQMDVDEMVTRWVPIIRGLATAHDKATLDQCEFEEEDHLSPLLAAPVKQLREFYAKLTQALHDDPTIPFFIWSMFEAWGEVIFKKAPDADIKTLKTDLAEEIARMAEEQVRPDLGKAIAAALQWRSPEALEKIHAELSAGKPAKMTGRSSCLFLQVGDATVML